MNYPIIWLIAAIIFTLIELNIMGLRAIWLTSGALVAFGMSFSTPSFLIQTIAFITCSLVGNFVIRNCIIKRDSE